jgi:mono/diheme cytochrome c family protein
MSTRARRGLIIIALVIAPFILGLLLTYQVIWIPLPTDMADSLAVGYQEGPRLALPVGSVPLQGQAVIPQEFPSNPIPADEVSIQRGQILYSIHCALCHGDQGRGDGPLAGYFTDTPARLSSPEAAAEFDGSVFLMITQGVSEMPPLAENLTVRERWDVINFVRTLAAGAQ